MNWFKGSVVEAITKAKQENSIFIVFVFDKSELSVSTRENFQNGDISEIFASFKYVAIEIENGSKDAIEFAQIYPLIVVPSLFFINSQSGVPLEVIAGSIDKAALIDRLKKADILTSGESLSKSVTENEATVAADADITNEHQRECVAQEKEKSESNSTTVEPALNSESVNNSLETQKSEQVNGERIADESSSASAVAQTVSSVEEKVERAKELINQRQELKANEEIESEKQREIERRRQNHELAKARQKREEQERIEITKQRKKDREEDRLARERVKAQIAADRAERQARLSLLKGEEPVQPGENPTSAASNPLPLQNENRNEVTRIKFRFPDDSSELSQFPPGATLRDVQKHLLEKCNLPFTKFKLVGTLPPRTFTESEMPLSLVQLGLSPSAIIIVKPLPSETSTSLAPLGQSVVMFLWSMFSPLIVLYEYLKGALGFGNTHSTRAEPSSDEEESQTVKRPRTEGSYTTRNRPKTAYGKRDDRGNTLKRDGNIHRLNHGREDDDDENNTWNGNSTQQM